MGGPFKCWTALVVCASLLGCQATPSGPEAREGYFTWVDEQGQVRYSRIPGKDARQGVAMPGEASSAGRISESGKGEAEFTPENYPDGNELAERGFVREGQRPPYFTWRDAQGNVRVSYYTPELPPGSLGSGEPDTATLTEASVYLPGEPPVSEPVSGYDPDAFEVLGIEPSSTFFERFSQSCCADIPLGDAVQWQAGREFGVAVQAESGAFYPFSTGDSAYRVVALPGKHAGTGRVIRLRSYVRDGVFVPSVVFLDDNRKPVRIVTDLVMTFEPETWSRRGYFEAWLPAFPERNERWMLLFSRGEDLRAQTVIDEEGSPRVIRHRAEGEIGLKAETNLPGPEG